MNTVQTGCTYIAKRKRDGEYVELEVVQTDTSQRVLKIACEADDLPPEWRPIFFYRERYEIIVEKTNSRLNRLEYRINSIEQLLIRIVETQNLQHQTLEEIVSKLTNMKGG